MDIFSGAARIMTMDARTWARHANPWSVYSRIIGGTFVFFALWSGFWLGWLACFPIGAVLFWLWLNPRLFPAPLTTDSWASKGVLGERVFLGRKTIPIPAGFIRAGWITTGLAMIFLGFAVYGFIQRDFWLAFLAWHASTVAKLWFVDRMALLWDKVKDTHPLYRSWNAGDWNVAQ